MCTWSQNGYGALCVCFTQKSNRSLRPFWLERLEQAAASILSPQNSLPSPYCALFARNEAPPPPYNAILTSRASSFHHACSTPYARDLALLCTLTRAPPSPEYSL